MSSLQLGYRSHTNSLSHSANCCTLGGYGLINCCKSPESFLLISDYDKYRCLNLIKITLNLKCVDVVGQIKSLNGNGIVKENITASPIKEFLPLFSDSCLQNSGFLLLLFSS